MRSLSNTVRRATDWLFDLLFPERCVGCSIRGDTICHACSIHIRKAERETSTGIIAAFDYRDPCIKKAIWGLKYYRRSHIAMVLGTLTYEALLEDIAEIALFTKGQKILVIPVPLSRERAHTRGYNQAEMLAQSFCRARNPELFQLETNLIVKQKQTIPQARISNRTARLKNIKHAFTLKRPEVIKGRTIIIIDDVTTTGGTLGEILSLCNKAGARKAYGFTVAH